MNDSPNNSSPALTAADWSQARTDKGVRAALLTAIDDGRFSCESAARAAGVGANMIRSWRHRQRKAMNASACKAGQTWPLAASQPKQAALCLDDDFEAQERAELEGLPEILAKRIKTADSGREAKAGAEALAIVLDLRRRAHGLPSTLTKGFSASPKVPVLVIGGAPLRLGTSKLEARPIDVRAVPVSPLEALRAGLPEWQRNL